MDNVVKMFQSPETLDEWKLYIAEATMAEKKADRTRLDAIVEKGKRIAEFHAAFDLQGLRWGRRWDDLCVEIVGLEKRTATRYEMVAKNVGLIEAHVSLPADLMSLEYLIRTKLADPKAFNAAVVAGEITPKTNRIKAEAILRRAEPKNVSMVRSKNGKPSRKEEPKITILYRDVTEKFRPLIKRVKEQSKRHAATVSFTELSIIAFELEQLAVAWTENRPELETHSAPVPSNRVPKGG